MINLDAVKLDVIYRVMNSETFGLRKAERIVGGRSRLLRLIEEGPVDYLTFDYLAEITMSIMQKARMKDSNLGYATDFVKLVGRIIRTCKEKNIKIIANAGGVNPKGCLAAIQQIIRF